MTPNTVVISHYYEVELNLILRLNSFLIGSKLRKIPYFVQNAPFSGQNEVKMGQFQTTSSRFDCIFS